MKANVTRLYDTLGRRYRQHTILDDTTVVPREEDYIWLEFLHRFGDQSSVALWMLTQDKRKDRKRAVNRMRQLRDCKFGEYGGPVLYYPTKQDAGAASKQDIDRRLICYSVQKTYGTKVLRKRNLYREHAPTTTYKHWQHFFMDSWVSTSIYFAVRSRPDLYRFHVHDEIVARLDGQTTFTVSYNYVTLEGKPGYRENVVVRPDRFFSIEYLTTGEERLFIQETDRGTERTDSDKPDVKNYRHTNYAYAALIGVGDNRRKYFPHWQRILVLNTFTSMTRMKSARNSMLDISDSGCNFMLYKHLPAFGDHFDPIAPDPSTFTQSWLRAGQPAIHINAI